MTRVLRQEPDLPEARDVAKTAFFFDFDGTLAEIVDDPRDAGVAPASLAALRALHEAAEGAVAVVSGRSIAQLDRMLGSLDLPLAGVHGMERRDADGRLHRVPIDRAAMESLARKVEDFAAARPGLLAESKPGSAALHYRKRPELGPDCHAFAHRLAAADSRIRLLDGKMVVEMKLGGRSKGDAIAEFMAEAPFRGRRALFAGDDVTDEAGFSVVNRLDGITIKVGAGPTRAVCRMAGVAAFNEWLRGLAHALSRPVGGSGTGAGANTGG